MKKRGLRRWIWRGVQATGALVLVVLVATLVGGWSSFGHRAAGARRARMEKSSQWQKGHFENPQPLWNDAWGMLDGMFHVDPNTSPSQPLPTVTGAPPKSPPATGLRVTWLGHSTLLVEIDGYRILTDPMFSARSSPLGWIGPRRWYPPPIPLEAIGPVDAVLLSHDHYDHLDRATISAMKGWNTIFLAPLGVGAHLAYWGVPESRIIDVDWWDRVRVRGLEIVCTPARHASGRQLFDKDATLWAGYALVGPKHRAYYSGDTGLFPAMREIGEKLGPFDLTMIEVGQYNRAWPDWHIGPEQAVRAHELLRGRVLLPIHWGLLTLAFHGWTEPIERAAVAAKQAGVMILTPRPGQPVEPDAPPSPERWWPEVPWKSGAEDPIVSTKMDPGGAR
ncbi:MAG: hypothetical protein JWN44_1145 [Myxococcales bacterium]|nr:hypothetical protein [Myxococcales bacterium]